MTLDNLLYAVRTGYSRLIGNAEVEARLCRDVSLIALARGDL